MTNNVATLYREITNALNYFGPMNAVDIRDKVLQLPGHAGQLPIPHEEFSHYLRDMLKAGFITLRTQKDGTSVYVAKVKG